MRFRDPSVLPLLAKAILETLNLPADHSPDMSEYRTNILDTQCRELEKFLRLRKSVAAQSMADELGIGDLARFVYKDQNKKRKMGDVGRRRFHFEHVVPVAVLKRRLLSLERPSIENIIDVIATAEVAWVTKDEDRELTRMSKRHRRDDHVRAYAEAKIELCPD